MSQMPIKSDSKPQTRTPRWVKVTGIIVIAMVLLFGVLHLTGNSTFGPGNHTMHIGQGLQQP